MRDDVKKYKEFSRRTFLIGAVQGALIAALASRFYYLQITNRNKYSLLSENNRIRVRTIAPARGIVVDRDNVVLIDNAPSYNLVIDSEDLDHAEEIISRVEKILSRSIFSSAIERARKAAIAQKASLILIQDIGWKDVVRIELQLDPIGAEIRKSFGRSYPFAEILGHLTGYVAKPSLTDEKENGHNFGPDFFIGKNGVEKVFESDIRGIPEVRKLEVTATGRVERTISIQESTPGKNLVLSVSSSVQSIVREQMKEVAAGTAVVMNPDNGEVLALYSWPSYDPNEFVNGVSSVYWKKLLGDPGKPLINKAILGNYPPGSIFKLVVALAALKYGIDPQQKVLCTGEYRVGSRICHCWKKGGHGYVDLLDAIAMSCNVYFYINGSRIGIDNIAGMARMLGLGEKSGIQLPYENAGLMPDAAWKRRKTGKPWRIGDTINASIGQGYVLVTPIQLANMASRLISGREIRPGLLTNNKDNAFPRISGVEDADRALVLEGMKGVFSNPSGSGHLYNPVASGLEIAGKTSTAQVISQRSDVSASNREHGVFLGFAPYSSPKYVVSIIVEHGGWGSKSALPIGVGILKALLL